MQNHQQQQQQQQPIEYEFASLQKYEIDRYTVLGRGSIALVFGGARACDQMPVSIKKFFVHVPNFSVVEEVNNCIRIKQYCDVEEQRWHGLVKILDLIYDNGDYYIVMERVHMDMFQHLESYKCSETLVAKLIHDIACALLKMHKGLNMIHGDIKLENIAIVSPNDVINNGGLRIKLFDFGSSLSFDGYDRSIDEGRMRIGPYGTEMYLSPEQVDGRLFSSASDAWGLGVLSLTFMMKRYPFRQEPRSQKLDEIRNSNHIPGVMRQSDFRFSEEAKGFVAQLLSIDKYTRLSLHDIVKNNWIVKHVNSYPRPTPPCSPIIGDKDKDKDKPLLAQVYSKNIDISWAPIIITVENKSVAPDYATTATTATAADEIKLGDELRASSTSLSAMAAMSISASSTTTDTSDTSTITSSSSSNNNSDDEAGNLLLNDYKTKLATEIERVNILNKYTNELISNISSKKLYDV